MMMMVMMMMICSSKEKCSDWKYGNNNWVKE
jgi:hypothetical protein